VRQGDRRAIEWGNAFAYVRGDDLLDLSVSGIHAFCKVLGPETSDTARRS
jgi:hypothetical protein